MNILNKLIYWYWRKYKDIPHPEELWYYFVRNGKIPNKNRPGFNIALEYSLGHSLPKLAKDYKVTRERVRQMIWKYYKKWKK